MLQTSNMLMPFFLTCEGSVWQQPFGEASWNENCQSLIACRGTAGLSNMKNFHCSDNISTVGALIICLFHTLARLVTGYFVLESKTGLWASNESHRYSHLILPWRLFFLLAIYSLPITISWGGSQCLEMCFFIMQLENWGCLRFPGAVRKKCAWVAFVKSFIKFCSN